MAYANMDRNRPATLALVGALHAAAIYALVVGLAGPVWQVIKDPPLVGEQIPLPKVTPDVTETPRTDPTRPPQTVQTDQTRTTVFVDTTNITLDDREIVLPSLGDDDGTAIDKPLPPEPPIATFAPKTARAVGKPGSWVTPNDYPAADLRAEHEGTTRFELSIGVDGKVQACRITVSSGFASLDAAACTNLRKRGRFTAATDATGAAVPGTYASVVRWTIPKGY